MWAQSGEMHDCAYKRAGRVRPVQGDCGRKVGKCVIAPTRELPEGGLYEKIVGAKRGNV